MKYLKSYNNLNESTSTLVEVSSTIGDICLELEHDGFYIETNYIHDYIHDNIVIEV